MKTLIVCSGQLFKNNLVTLSLDFRFLFRDGVELELERQVVVALALDALVVKFQAARCIKILTKFGQFAGFVVVRSWPVTAEFFMLC